MAAQNGFPTATTAGQGLFNGASSNGMIQGQADPDPATRFALQSGIVSANETVPMWGGIGVYADISPVSTTGPKRVLGPSLGRATALTGASALVGFSVFDQGYNMVTDPQNPVPTSGSGQSLNYYTLGSRARIAVACDPALISLRGGLINQQVSWDFQAQMLVEYTPAYTAVAITGATWNNTSGGEAVFTVGTDLTAKLAAGSTIDVSGVVSTGGTGAGYNGTFVVAAVTSNSITVLLPSASSPGTYSAGGTIAAAGGALPVTVTDIQPSGNMTVVYQGGLVTYNYSGACAKIQLTGGTVA